jgi:hypothetical protein
MRGGDVRNFFSKKHLPKAAGVVYMFVAHLVRKEYVMERDVLKKRWVATHSKCWSSLLT